jgi:hypothetical protein
MLALHLIACFFLSRQMLEDSGLLMCTYPKIHACWLRADLNTHACWLRADPNTHARYRCAANKRLESNMVDGIRLLWNFRLVPFGS